MKTVIVALGAGLMALGAASAETRSFGHIAGSATWQDQELFIGANADLWKYNIQGAIGFEAAPRWNVQFDAAFTNDAYADLLFFDGPSFESYRAGTQIFWRDPSQGMVGVEFAYQSFAGFGDAIDGYVAGLKGEYYAGANTTIGGGLTYSLLTPIFGSADAATFGGNAFVTYYASDTVGLSLRTSYNSTDIDISIGTQDIWTVSADVEYLFTGQMSVSASAGYTTNDYFAFNSFDAVSAGVKLKFYFGTEGSLANQHRNSTLESTITDLSIMPLD